MIYTKILLAIFLTWMYNVSCDSTYEAACEDYEGMDRKIHGNTNAFLYLCCKATRWALVAMLWGIAFHCSMPNFTAYIPMFGVILGTVSMISYHC